MITAFFSVLITEHRLWGTIFQPFMLEEKNTAFYTIRELVTLKNSSAYSLSEMEKQIVLLCNKYSEENMLKLFFREKISIAEFQRKYERNPQEYEHIPQFIDKCNYQVAKVLIGSDVPVFHRKDSYMNIYTADAVSVPAGYATHVAVFERTESFLNYSLRVYREGVQVSLKGKKTVCLSNSPCCMLSDSKLFVFEKLDGKRITPFLKSEKITIPKEKEAVYLKTFVLNTLKEEQVEATGLEINRERIKPVPVLTVLEDFQKNIALQLSFRYGKRTFSTEVLSKRQVVLQETDGNYVFNVFERDMEREPAYIRLVESLGFAPYNLFFHLKEKSEFPLYTTLEILQENRSKLVDFEINSDFDEKIYSFEKISLSTDFNVENDWFDLHGNVQIGAFNIPFIKFRKHILSGTREYVLPDKTIAILPEEWFTRFSELFKFSEENGDRIRLKKFYFGMMDSFKEKVPDTLAFDHEIQKEVPEEINAELRSYQKTGFSWLVYLYENNFGGCLADDMGLGKTLQFLTFFQYIYKKTKEKETERQKQDTVYQWRHKTAEPTLFDLPPAPSKGGGEEHSRCKEDEGAVSPSPLEGAGGRSASLVVLPTSLLHNWKNEKEKFAPALSAYLYSGSKRLRSREIGKIFDHYNLILTTYGTMRNDIEFLSQYEFECVALDESQYIKNTSSQIYQSVSKLKARHFFVMTGTPIENSLNDLWAQLNFVNRDMLGSPAYFKNHFVLPIVNQQNEEREKRLQQIIKPFILRRTKSEVAKDLPPVIEQTVYCEMAEEQQKIYISEKSAVRNNLFEHILQSGLQKNTMLAISALLRLRQLANHPSLVLDDYAGESAKIEEVISRIESLRAENHKVLIFSSFVKLLQLVETRLQQAGIEYEMLTGETQKREEVIRRFQEKPTVGCFLISLKAGGVGLNLTAADYVFILDPWWNPAAELQAINRAHRIGQDKTVMVYRFISVDTIEEKIQRLQSAKSKLAETFINSNNPFADLDVSDVEGLFE